MEKDNQEISHPNQTAALSGGPSRRSRRLAEKTGRNYKDGSKGVNQNQSVRHPFYVLTHLNPF